MKIINILKYIWPINYFGNNIKSINTHTEYSKKIIFNTILPWHSDAESWKTEAEDLHRVDRPIPWIGDGNPGTKVANIAWIESGAFSPRAWYHNKKYLKWKKADKNTFFSKNIIFVINKTLML